MFPWRACNKCPRQSFIISVNQRPCVPPKPFLIKNRIPTRHLSGVTQPSVTGGGHSVILSRVRPRNPCCIAYKRVRQYAIQYRAIWLSQRHNPPSQISGWSVIRSDVLVDRARTRSVCADIFPAMVFGQPAVSIFHFICQFCASYFLILWHTGHTPQL